MLKIQTWHWQDLVAVDGMVVEHPLQPKVVVVDLHTSTSLGMDEPSWVMLVVLSLRRLMLSTRLVPLPVVHQAKMERMGW
jgi:hypothetical protein